MQIKLFFSKNKTALIVLAIFLISLFVRISLVTKGPYHIDTLFLAINAEKTLDTLQLHKQTALGFPLAVILGSISVAIARLFEINDPVLAVNYMSVVLSSFGVVLMFFLGKELFGLLAGLYGAVLLSLSPIYLGLSLYGKSQMPFMFFLLLGVLFFVRYQRTFSRKDLLISACAFGLMGAVRAHELVLMVIPIMFLTLTPRISTSPDVSDKKNRLGLKDFVLFFAVILITIFIFYLPLLLKSGLNRSASELSNYMEYGLLRNYLGIFSPRLLNVLKYFSTNFSPPGLLLFALSIIYLAKKNLITALFFLLWLLVPIAYYGNLYVTVTPRYFIVCLPPVILAMSYLLSGLGKHKFPFNVLSFIAVILIVFYPLSKVYPHFLLRHHTAYLPEFVKWADTKMEPNAQIICSDERIFFDYYGSKTTIAKPTHTFSTIPTDRLLEFKQKLDSLLENDIPIYIHTTALHAYNINNEFVLFIDKNYYTKLVGFYLFDDWHIGMVNDQIHTNHLLRLYKR